MFTNIQKISAQNVDTVNIFNYTIADLVNMRIKSFLPDSSYYMNNIPYITQVITEDEIKSCGSTDLMELLRYMSGIDFGTDVIGQSGIIVNGIWGHEGKVLIMIDGIPLNEFMFGSTQFGYHYPLDNVEKIEIIRGSGSVLIGTFAEIMVINIITKSGNKINGVQAWSDIGIGSKKNPFYQNYALSVGKAVSKNFNVSAFGRLSRGYRSNFDYTDIYGDSFNLTENKLNDLFATLKIQYKNLSIASIYDNYQTTSRDYFINILSRAYPKNFTTYATIVDYKQKLSKKTNLKFNILLKHEKPWVSPLMGSLSDTLYYPLIQEVTTIYPKTVLTFYFTPQLRLSFGGDMIFNKAFDKSPGTSNYFWNGKPQVQNSTYAQFAELYFSKNNNLTMSLGERAEYNPIYGSVFLPRVGISKRFSDKIIFKYTYDKSFRPPTIANITYNIPLSLQRKYPLIRPEITHYFNAILTFLFNKASFSISTFYIDSKNAITYFLDSQGNEGYANVAHLSTDGFSMQFNYLLSKFYLKAYLDFQHAANYDTLQLYYIDPKDKTYLGTSSKLGICLRYKVTEWLTFKNNLLVIDRKKGYYHFDPVSQTLIGKTFPATFILSPGIYVDWKNLHAGIFAYNLLNQKDYLIQPYRGWHAPLLNRGRVIYFSLQYKFNF